MNIVHRIYGWKRNLDDATAPEPEPKPSTMSVAIHLAMLEDRMRRLQSDLDKLRHRLQAQKGPRA